MNVTNIVPHVFKNLSHQLFDLELVRFIAESEAFAWWQDYCERYQPQIMDSYQSDDCYLASITKQAS